MVVFWANHFLEDMSAEKVLLRDPLLSVLKSSIDPIPFRLPPMSSSSMCNDTGVILCRWIRRSEADHCIYTTKSEIHEATAKTSSGLSKMDITRAIEKNWGCCEQVTDKTSSGLLKMLITGRIDSKGEEIVPLREKNVVLFEEHQQHTALNTITTSPLQIVGKI